MRPNFIGMIAGVLGFVSLVLPWWTLSFSGVYGGSNSGQISIYLYQLAGSGFGGRTATYYEAAWFSWTVLVLIIIGSVIAFLGSITNTKRRVLLALGSALFLVAIILFPIAQQISLSEGSILEGSSLFSFQTTGIALNLFSMGVSEGLNYSTYLSFGFWIAFFATVLMLVATARKRVQKELFPPPPPSSQQSV